LSAVALSRAEQRSASAEANANPQPQTHRPTNPDHDTQVSNDKLYSTPADTFAVYKALMPISPMLATRVGSKRQSLAPKD
jgi:hypothetical protein